MPRFNHEKDFKMLCISRKKNQSFTIEGQIVVTVLRIEGNKVKLGIEAPRSVQVVRTDANKKEPKC